METNHDYFVALFSIIIVTFIIGVVAGWFLHYFIKENRKEKKPSFKFFHKEKLYDFGDALIFLQWYHGDEGQNYSYLVRFPDETYFRIEFHNYGIPPDVDEHSKEKMIKILQRMTKSFPNEALAALKLLES